jgi:hypothetical protein
MVESEGNVVIATTNAQGDYVISSLTKGDYVLSFSKSDVDGAITAYDAALILQRNVGLISFTDGQNVVADVDNNGRINAMDASYILQYAAGFVTLPFNGRNSIWLFSLNNVDFSDVFDDQSLSVTAYLIGDVSGNYGSGVANQLNMTNALRIGQIEQHEQYLSLVVGMLSNMENILSVEFTVNYPANLKIMEVQFDQRLKDAMKIINVNEPGRIRIVIASEINIPHIIEEIVRIKFFLPENFDYDFTLSNAIFNESNNVSLFSNSSSILIYDFNEDGKISIEDILCLIEQNQLEENQVMYFDYNLDGIVDIFDLILMSRYNA